MAWPAPRRYSSRRRRALGQEWVGPPLAVAPRPTNKYLTFQAYRGAGPERRPAPLPPRLVRLVLPGVGTRTGGRSRPLPVLLA